MAKTVKIIIVDTGAPRGQSGRSFVGGDADPADRNGHATNVAAVIRERAPAAQLVFFKATPKSGCGSPTDLASALLAAADEAPDIVNVSLAVPRGEPRLRRAVRALRATGALIVCGAGNDAKKGIQWPARYPETVSVGALGRDGKPARFSPTACDLMVPGERVPVSTRGHGRAPVSGTSIACAVASGMLAAAMSSGAKDALEEVKNTPIVERNHTMSLKSKIEKLIEKWLRKLVAAAKTSTASPASAGTVPDGAPLSVETAAGDASSAADAVDFSQLDFRWGGFNGRGAQLADGCRIAGLKVSASGMSYKWEKGGCEKLGASGKSDYSHTLACFFVQGQDGKWRGGKFDWISTSRTTRDFANIRSGYHGWPTESIAAATGYAFVIVSADGKKRTNVIKQGK